MPRPSNTDRRRAEIAEALKRVMATKGYDGATVADIAAAAGLTAGLVHYHFSNKLEILLLVLDRLAEAHEARLTRGLDDAGDPISAVRLFIDLHLSVGDQADPEAVASWIVLGSEAMRQEAVRERYAAALSTLTERLAERIRQGVRAGVLGCPEDEVEAAACGIMAAIQGYFTLAASARSLIPRGSAAAATHRMAEGLLRPRRPLSASGAAPRDAGSSRD